MVQTQWQQTLRRKIGLSGAFFRITYNQSAETKWTRRVFHRFNLAIGGGSLAEAQCLFRRLLAYSYSNDLGLYAEEIDGRTGDAQAVFGAILGGFVSAQLMNCRGRGGTDFYRFLCPRLVRRGTVADRATPCAPAPKGTFRSNNRH